MGEDWKFCCSGIFLPGNRNLRWSGFDDLNLFQSYKQLSKHQLKSNLVWPVCPKSMELKQNWYRSSDYNYKWCFCWFITWKLLFSGGVTFGGWDKNLVGGESTVGFFQVREQMSKFLVGGWGIPFHHPK